jgi:hypothetical protein
MPDHCHPGPAQAILRAESRWEMPRLAVCRACAHKAAAFAQTGIAAGLEKTRAQRRKLFNMLITFLFILPWALLAAMPALAAAVWLAGIGH